MDKKFSERPNGRFNSEKFKAQVSDEPLASSLSTKCKYKFFSEREELFFTSEAGD